MIFLVLDTTRLKDFGFSLFSRYAHTIKIIWISFLTAYLKHSLPLQNKFKKYPIIKRGYFNINFSAAQNPYRISAQIDAAGNRSRWLSSPTKTGFA